MLNIYISKIKFMSEDKKPNNEIRIGFRSKPKDIIAKCENLLKEEKVKDLHLSAVGNSIGDLVVIVEIMKLIIPGINQISTLSTISPRTNIKEKKDEPKNKSLQPRLEIILSMQKLPENKEGSKTSFTEKERQLLIDSLDKKKDALKKERKFRKSFITNRRRRYNGNFRRQGFGYSANRTSYNKRRNGYNRRRFEKNPSGGRKSNDRKFNGTSKNSGNKQSPVKN